MGGVAGMHGGQIDVVGLLRHDLPLGSGGVRGILELDTTPARVALAWVSGRPGVASPILGARTLAQLDDNLAALDVKLAPEHVAALEQQGVTFHGPVEDEGRLKLAYFTDPDGNELYLAEARRG